MKKLLLILPILLLTSCSSECSTKECYDAKTAYEIAKSENKEKSLEKERSYKIELKKIEAEIEKSKPVAVKVQELKNEETTVWEWIMGAVWIWAATYLWGKVLGAMIR